jgi:RNA 3'-terminal phosphate cyclase (ATP)
MQDSPPPPLVLDGAVGEGGGQILRTAVSLSAVTGRAVRIFNIRAGRPKPGLMKQHLVALEAARDVSGSQLSGGVVGSTDVTFSPPSGGTPFPLRASYAFDIGSAGSTTLVFQTLLPIFLARLPRGSSTSVALTITGGTHNPMAPSATFLAAVLAPALRAAGVGVDVFCERAGFYPAGGGVLRATVCALPAGGPPLAAPALLAGGAVARFRATVLATAALPRAVASKQAAALAAALALPPGDVVVDCPDAVGPGNAVLVALDRAGGALGELVCACGDRGLAAEEVAGAAAAEALALAASSAPFSEHAADQLLLPLLVVGGGAFRAVSVGAASQHFSTNVGVLDAFVGSGQTCVDVAVAPADATAPSLDPGVVVTVKAVALDGVVAEGGGGVRAP